MLEFSENVVCKERKQIKIALEGKLGMCLTDFVAEKAQGIFWNLHTSLNRDS